MKNQYLWAVFLLVFTLLNYPLFQLYNVRVLLGGVPSLFFFVFLFLAFSSGLTFWVVRKTKKEDNAE